MITKGKLPHLMNGIIFLFNIGHLSWIDDQKNARKCRWRKSHSKIEAADEFGLAMQRKGSSRACLHCIRDSEENHIWKSKTSEVVEWAASKNGETCNGRLFIKLLLTREYWRKMVFSSGNLLKCWKPERWDLWVNNQPIYLFTAHRQVCHWWRWYGLQHRHRIRPFVKVTIILAQGEWSSAKDAGPTFKKMQCKTLRNTLCFGECLCLLHYEHLYAWRRITQSLCIPSKIQRKISQWNRCSTYLRNW